MASGKGVFGSIKNKLGLGGGSDAKPAQYEEYEEYDEYDEYGAYDDVEPNRGYGGFDDYDPYADSVAPRGFGNRNTVTTRNVGRGASARLVSTGAARESARNVIGSGLAGVGAGAASADTAPISPARRSSSRTTVDSSLPAVMTPEGTAALSQASNRRSSGLDSLFASTDDAPGQKDFAQDGGMDAGGRAARAFSAGSVSGERASCASESFGHRQLQVIRPASYNDAEAVVRALKAGEVAVLNMQTTDPALAKRVLDFAFGAACALGANVESPARGVYAVAIGAALSDREKSDLSARGVL